jgi:guanosine-3',5'-bis(diphosphate) 3'-pyrophosphohydrolase
MHEPELLGVLDALAFSAARHRHQKRKGRLASPYINHPIDVALIIVRDGGVASAPVLTAALLHDTIEDTDTTHDELTERFGHEVANIVLEVSDDPTLSKAEQRRRQELGAASLSYGAKLIRIADKISNIRDLVDDPPSTWGIRLRRDYLEWTRRVVDRCRGTNEGLERAYDAVYAHARKAHDALALDVLSSGRSDDHPAT